MALLTNGLLGHKPAAGDGGGLTSPVGLADGGTGATTASGARTALDVPSNAEMTSAASPQVTAGVTASTTQTQGQGAISVTSGKTAIIVEVATCANANDTITLPAAVAGLQVFVINNGANTLKIFPASGDNLGAGANTATTLAAGATATFVAYDSTNWKALV